MCTVSSSKFEAFKDQAVSDDWLKSTFCLCVWGRCVSLLTTSTSKWMTLEHTAAGVPHHYHALHSCNYHPQPHVQVAALLINLTRNIPFQMQPSVDAASFQIFRRIPKVMAVVALWQEHSWSSWARGNSGICIFTCTFEGCIDEKPSVG